VQPNSSAERAFLQAMGESEENDSNDLYSSKCFIKPHVSPFLALLVMFFLSLPYLQGQLLNYISALRKKYFCTKTGDKAENEENASKHIQMLKNTKPWHNLGSWGILPS